ncbi:hypothetical protein L9W92_18110 [Pelotomaculum terephthalicicum JT]|uniref:hypothetical protein n=1 Tax=Pelotomaculum terephthalicicum TaxID=206393 RepID=UPI0009D5FBA7|nr:hypothetical protein [Pelotomaculum terephthalicicum]MCG9969913.1 hypothetical protein [Pelotomaculum terephthalicicum JT]OPX83699.1 MAG: Trehalose synthase [Pelotomaculum sp. PtaB.Bin104]
MHINSTLVGGGVAEILRSLVPLMQEVESSPRWVVLEGNPEFFNTTKLFHNVMHNQPVNITGEMLESYLAIAQKNKQLVGEEAE